MAQVTFTNGTPDLLTASLAAAACVLVAAGAGLVLFAFAATRTPAAASIALLAGSTVRMLASVSMALVVYFLGRMDAKTGTAFWIVFLICGLAAIVVEAAWGVKNLNRPASSAASPISPSIDESSTPSPLASAHGTH